MFQDLDTTMCGIKRKKNIFWGLGEQNITINQQQFNTQTHTRNITVAGTQCSQLGGGGDEADGDRLSRHRCPSQAHTPSRQHPLAVYRYTLKSIYTTHTTKNIYTGPKEEKRHYKYHSGDEKKSIYARIPAGWRIRSYFLGRHRATIIGNDVVVVVVLALRSTTGWHSFID